MMIKKTMMLEMESDDYSDDDDGDDARDGKMMMMRMIKNMTIMIRRVIMTIRIIS